VVDFVRSAFARAPVLVWAAACFAVITAVRFAAGAGVGNGIAVLYVIPICLLAVRYEVWGGIGGAVVALALLVAWVLAFQVALPGVGYYAGICAFLVVGAMVGRLSAHRRHAEEELRLLVAERERLLAQSQTMALTDELTTLPNRRAWEGELQRELARSMRSGDSLSLAMIDLDDFKGFNDDRGHLAGDAALTKTAAAWVQSLREVDFLARYGGEEFGVLLPGCSSHEALHVIDRLRAATPEGLTCSAGLATWDREQSAQALVARADAALYDAKRAGRDRSCLAEDRSSLALP
jgi:diguanylate cyclase (GGDEF)-like protein